MKERYRIKINRNDGLSIALEKRNNYIDCQEFVGREIEKKRLISWLVDNEQADSKVISVWGMVGLGKTTLVFDVYRDNQIKAHFDCCAWVYYKIYSGIEELLALLRDFPERLSYQDEKRYNLHNGRGEGGGTLTALR